MSQVTPSVAQLKRAIAVSEQIEKLQAELQSILGSTGSSTGKRKYTKRVVAAVADKGAPTKKRKKRTMSPEGRAKIVAAQKARWAKIKKAKKQGAPGLLSGG